MAQQLPVALVTGASRGIGKAIATDLARTHHILVGGSNQQLVERVVNSLPSASPWAADLTNPREIDVALAGLKRLDVLVHAAGIAIEKPITEVTADDWHASFSVNVFSIAQIAAATMPLLRKSSGIVVLINSGSGMFSYAGGSP